MQRPSFLRRHWATLLGVCLLAGWVAVLQMQMIVDVWDETRALQLVEEHGFAELVASNWMQAETGGGVILRPLPMLVFTAVAKAVGNPELSWKLLRWLNATFVVASLMLLVSSMRRLRGPAPQRELLFGLAVFGSAAALIAGAWFANIFDAMALLGVAASLRLLVGERPRWSGAVLGAAFFCKEIALLGLLAGALMAWLGELSWRRWRRSATLSVPLFLLYAGARSLVVPPGSGSDLRGWDPVGMLEALGKLPVVLPWQVPNVPVVWLGPLVLLLLLTAIPGWRPRLAVAAVLGAAAVVYGPLIHLGTTPLLHADNFAPRLYLLPGVLVFFLSALYGRRWAVALLLPTLLWGGLLASERHLRFQGSYEDLYELVPSRSGGQLPVLCTLYRPAFHDRRRGIHFGVFPRALWRLDADGRVLHRDRPDAEWMVVGSRRGP